MSTGPEERRSIPADGFSADGFSADGFSADGIPSGGGTPPGRDARAEGESARLLERFDRVWFGEGSGRGEPGDSGELRDIEHSPVFRGLRALRDAIAGDPDANRVPDVWTTPEAEAVLLDQIRDAALASVENGPVESGSVESGSGRRADWIAALSQPCVMPAQNGPGQAGSPAAEAFGFAAQRQLRDVLDGALEDAEMRLGRFADGAVVAELRRSEDVPVGSIPVESLHDTQRPHAEDVPRRGLSALEPSELGALLAERLPLRAVEDGASGESEVAGTASVVPPPAWLWARIRSDLGAHRRALLSASRRRVLSRLALAAALVVVLLTVWPVVLRRTRDAGPEIHIQIIQSDRPLDARFSTSAVLRRLHDEAR